MEKMQLMLEAERRGILPPDQKALLDEARRRGLVGGSAPQPAMPEPPPKPLYQRAWEAVSGNAAEQLPDLFGEQFGRQAKGIRQQQGRSELGGSAKLSAAAMFGDDEDLLNAVRREFPDATVDQDANGNPIVRMPDGQRYYVNQPGLDVTDVGRFAGKVLQYVPAARAAGLGGGTLARAGIGAAASGGTNIGTQIAAGREKINPSEVLTTALFGGGAELLAPLAQRAGAGIASMLRPEANKLEIGRGIARQAGIENASDDAARALYESRAEVAAGASPAAVLAEKLFGFKLTQGQKTGNAAQLDYEDFLRQLDTSSSNPLVLAKDFNEAQIGRVNQTMRTQLARGQPAPLEQDSARAIQDALLAAQKQGQQRVRQAYSAADTAGKGIFAAADDFSRIPQQIDRALRGKVALSPELTPATLGARNLLGDFAEDAGDAAVSLKRIEELRKRLNELRGSAKSPTDVRAMSALFEQFDDQVHGAIVRNMMDGGPEALEALKQARGEASRMFRLFSTDTPAGRRIMQSMAEEATPEQVANFFVGANGLNAAQASAVAKRYLKIVGQDSQAANALRDLVARRMFDAKGTGRQSADVTANSLQQALEGKGNSLLTTLFNKTDMEVLRQYNKVLREALLPPSQILRTSVGPSSGTTERFMRWLSQSKLRSLPFFQTVVQAGARYGSSAALAPPRVIRPNLLPATGAASGTFADDEIR